MRKHIITSLVALNFSAFLSAQESNILPEKAKILKDSYQAAVERATAPLTKTYIAELSNLKVEFTKKADLQGALAIERELLTYTAKTQQSSISRPTAYTMPTIVGRWTWIKQRWSWETTFSPDATFENEVFRGTWEVKGQNLTLDCHLKRAPDKKYELHFKFNVKDGTYTGKDDTNDEVTLKP